MSDQKQYTPASGLICLTGPVERPPEGTLPLRGDLAHIALAERFMVPHYASPTIMHIGDRPAALRQSIRHDDDGEAVVTLEPGSAFEALDVTASWVWGALGPEGPAGYVERSAFA